MRQIISNAWEYVLTIVVVAIAVTEGTQASEDTDGTTLEGCPHG